MPEGICLKVDGLKDCPLRRETGFYAVAFYFVLSLLSCPLFGQSGTEGSFILERYSVEGEVNLYAGSN